MLRLLTGVAAAMALMISQPAFAQQTDQDGELYEKTQRAEDAAGDVVEETRTGIERSADEAGDSIRRDTDKAKSKIDDEVQETRTGIERSAKEADESIKRDADKAERKLNDEVHESRTPESRDSEGDGAFEGTGQQIEDTAENVGEELREAIIPTGERAQMAHPKTFSLEGGVGFSNYTGRLGRNFKVGPGWNVRAAYKADSLIGAELGYFGAANPRKDSLEPGNWSFLNGLDLAARVSLQNKSIFRPFLSGGVGFSYMNTFFESNLDLVGGREVGDTWMMHFPVGVGVNSYPGENLMVGLRYDYRFQTNIINNDIPYGNNWQLILNAGATF